MMTTLIDTLPDTIEQHGDGAYRFYFTQGQNIKTLPIGAEYMVVCSPIGYTGKWRAICFRVVSSPLGKVIAVQIDGARTLNAYEITHFEALMDND